MSETGIPPGAFVWYASKGIGRVEETGDRLSVLFWADRKSGKPERLPPNLLTPLADYILQANPQGKTGNADPWKRFQSGAKKAPLKLVALALSACGNSGGTADIREKLDKRAPIGSWGSWWKRTEPKLAKLPTHFKIDGAGAGVKYALLSSVADVPADWIEPKVKLADWKKWLTAKTHEQAPGRFPTRQVADSLAKWPAKDIEQALLRLIVTVEGALADGSVSAQSAEGWLRAVAQASVRLREAGGRDTRGYLAARAGTLLAQLAKIAGDRAPQDLLLQAGALDGETDAWRRGFLAGMWDAFEGEDAREIYRRASSVLGRQARDDLARQVALAAFGPEMSDRRHSELDRLLDALPDSERLHILEEVIARATTGQRAEVLDYIANSRHASGNERLPLRIVAVLMLSEGQGKLAARTSWELAESLASPDSYGPEVKALYENTAARVQAIMAFNAGNLEELKETHETRIEQERQEQERLRQQVRERNAELAANREESRLEIRQDMLLAVGEVIQSVSSGGDSGEMAAGVQAGLNLALRAGGAEPLEAQGKRVGYDPEIHSLVNENNEDAGGLADSSPVMVVAPGVVVRGETSGDRILLKAQVRHEAS